jgi:pyrophosphatase PpaX
MPSPSRPARPAAVLFDLDGTLIDSIDLILKSAQYAFLKCGLTAPTDQEWLTGVGRPLPTMFRQFSAGDAQVETLIAAYREFQMANHDTLVQGYPGVPEMLGTLAADGHPLAIVTSKTTTLAARGLAHLGLDKYFGTIVGMDSSTRHKPDPEPVLIALDRLSYEAGEAWFVGDSVHDMESGNAAGVSTIGALWGPFGAGDLAPSKPRFMAQRAADVPGIVGAGAGAGT